MKKQFKAKLEAFHSAVTLMKLEAGEGVITISRQGSTRFLLGKTRSILLLLKNQDNNIVQFIIKTKPKEEVHLFKSRLEQALNIFIDKVRGRHALNPEPMKLSDFFNHETSVDEEMMDMLNLHLKKRKFSGERMVLNHHVFKTTIQVFKPKDASIKQNVQYEKPELTVWRPYTNSGNDTLIQFGEGFFTAFERVTPVKREKESRLPIDQATSLQHKLCQTSRV